MSISAYFLMALVRELFSFAPGSPRTKEEKDEKSFKCTAGFSYDIEPGSLWPERQRNCYDGYNNKYR